jgi:hypothetical protein
MRPLIQTGFEVHDIDRFMSSKDRSVWVENSTIKIYVRKGMHILDRPGEVELCLDLATIEVRRPSNGYFTWLLPHLEQIAFSRGMPVYVESIVTDRFYEFFLKRGYSKAWTHYCVFRRP